DIVASWANFHGLSGDIQIPKLLELMVHAWELALDGFCIALIGYIQKHAAMRTAPTGEHLSPDRARHNVTRQQVWRPARLPVALEPAFGFLGGISRLSGEHRRDIVEHEALAPVVQQHPTVTPHAFGDQDTAYAEGPDHTGRVELHKLHIHQF